MRNQSIALLLPLLLSVPVVAQTISVPSTLGASVGVFFSFTPVASGGTAPYTWTPVGNPMPSGLTIQFDTGVMNGIPQVATNPATGYTVRLQITDAVGRVATKDVIFNIRQPLDFGPTITNNGVVGSAYEQCFLASGGTAEIGIQPAYSVLTGVLPDGLSIVSPACASTGLNLVAIQGTPTRAGTFVFTLQALDSENRLKQRVLSITIEGPPSFVLSPATVDFSCTIGSAATCSPSNTTTVTLLSSGAALSPITAAVTSSGTWLSVTCCDALATPSRLTITVTPSQLTQTGSTIGTIQVSGGPGVTPVTITVRVNVTATVGSFVATPTALTFGFTPGGTVPPPQIINLTPGSATETAFTVAVSTNSGGNWLFSNTNKGSTPAGISIQANGNGLAVGTYTGQITISSVSFTIIVPVTLNVFSTNQLNVSPLSVSFNVQNGVVQAGSQQQLTIGASGGFVTYTAQANTVSGGAWLSVSPPTGLAPATALVGLTSLIPGPGSYSGSITVSAPGLPTQTVIVTLTVTGTPALVVSPSSLSFTAAFGGANPSGQALTVGTNGSPVSFSATASVRENIQWLSVSQSAGVTPLTLQVVVNAIGLTAGSYSGTILFSASSTTNGQIVIPVNLTVQASSSITANPASLTFQYQIGGTVPNQLSVQLNSSAGAVAYSIAANSSGWLNASPSSGTTPSSIQISINPVSLTAGTYSGNILVQASAANGSQTIPVVLTVTNPPPITSSASALNFSARVGGGSPVAQVLQISSLLGQTRFSATANSVGGNWLTVTQSSGTTPASVTVNVNQSGLGSGIYTGSVQLAVLDSPGGSVTIPVTLSVTTPVVPVVKAITSTASFLVGDISPGMIFTVFGSSLGPDVATGVQLSAGVVQTSSGSTRVLFNDVPAPMLYSSEGQVIGVVPYAMAGQRTARMMVEYLGIRSAAFDVTIAGTAPAIFTANSSGRGQAAALNEDGSLNSSSNPALPGKVVVLFLTGEGLSNPQPGDGQLTGFPLSRPLAAVTVRMGTQPVQVQYIGSAPGQVAGFVQLNITVPTGIAGDVPVSVNIGGNSSQSSVTVAVKDVRP